MPKTGYLKGHKEYAGAYDGQKASGSGPKTVTNSPVPVPDPSFKPMGNLKKMSHGKKKSHNPGY